MLSTFVLQPTFASTHAMNEENQLLVTDEPVEFERLPVGVQGFRKFTNCSREIYGVCLKSIKKN